MNPPRSKQEDEASAERMRESARLLGLDPDALPEGFYAPRSRVERDTDFEVMPENWPAVSLFLRCQRSWHLTPDGHRMALNRQELIMMGRTYRVENLPSVLDDILLMEATILVADHEARVKAEARRKLTRQGRRPGAQF